MIKIKNNAYNKEVYGIGDSSPEESSVIDYLNIIKKINRFEHEGATVVYTDEIWDFNLINNTSKGKTEYRLNFKVQSGHHVEALKDYAILYLKFVGKFSSARKRVANIRRIIDWMDNNAIYTFENLTKADIEQYIGEQKWRGNTEFVNFASLKLFFTYQKVFFNNNVYDDIKECLVSDAKYQKAVMKESKMPDIPNNYFDRYMAECIKIMNDETAQLSLRGVACILIILSQTGLRISEVLTLKVACISTVYSKIKDKNLTYLNYKVWKRVKKINTEQDAKTFVNDLTCIAINTLIRIYAYNREYLRVDYLYLGGKATMTRRNYPVGRGVFSSSYIDFSMEIDKTFKIVDIENKEWSDALSLHKIDKNKNIQRMYPGTKRIILPKLHQFRVHLCTELYNKGVSHEYIEVFMGHLSAEMEGYYVRSKDNLQEDMAYSQKVIKSIVVGETRILGDTLGISEKIQEFIKKGNYNVAKDLDQIVSQLVKKIPIRQKTGGVCIKSSQLRECSTDAMTNEFYCAYSVCPNIFHFFYMIDVSYRQCKELEETIKYNAENGFKKQAEKERNMLKHICEKKLLSELKELNIMIEKKGIEYIRAEYPQTAYFIDNKDEVERVIGTWRTTYC